MSTSLLYHAFGIQGYLHVSTQYVGGEIFFRIRHNPLKLRCPCCGGLRVTCRGQKERSFNAPPVGSKRVTIVLPVQRVACEECQIVRQVNLGFAEVRRTYTKSFERFALELSKHMTIKDVAHHLGVSWDIIKDIQKRYLSRRYSRPKLKKLRRIAIDEIAIGRGHRYLTVVLDLFSGAVVFIGDGKGSDALTPFWKKLKRARADIEAVAVDMSAAYISAVRKSLPEALIVFDHFHVIKLFNEKLSNLRRDLQREAEDQLQKKVLKGTRWLLLKNPENLDEKRNEHQRLEEALQINRPLAIAYYMKEDLRTLWTKDSKEQAQEFLNDWIARADSSGVKILKKFARTLAIYRNGLLAFYDVPITTGPLEGTNTKIRVLQRQAYGFRDPEFFKLKIFSLHETKYALVG